ncbi:unnamed protein product [Cunninghamella blakesleeana]
MQPRKSSCLNCRTRKVKCDKKDTCSKCLKTESKCVYQKMGNLGRPPKNTVFHGKNKNSNVQTIGVREFIFENMNDYNTNDKKKKNKTNKENKNHSLIKQTLSTTTTTNRMNINTISYLKAAIIESLYTTEWWTLCDQTLSQYKYVNDYFQMIYSCYLIRGDEIRDRCLTVTYQLPEKPKIKFYCLKRLFTWWAALSVNVLLKRASRFKLETYTVPPIALYMFQMNDAQHNINTFSIPTSLEKNHHQLNNPLQSLPPEQAMNYFETFFSVNPYSILINKTKLIDEYWSDTATPLLLSVIYGTTICFSQHLQGLPIGIWETSNEENRNPFLTYAYQLLKNTPITPTADTYRAIVILALFEALWGYPKFGISLLSTSYAVGTQLGLWDNTYKPNDPVEEELVNMTFWTAFRSSTYGCLELGLNIVDSLIQHQRPFPPANIADSLSFLYDHTHGNSKVTNQCSYVYETYHAGAVISYYTGIIYACLPKSTVNVFGHPTQHFVFTGSHLLSSLRKINDIETRLYTILDDFAKFIESQKYQWSSIQLYTIRMTYLLYRIHFRFLRPAIKNGKVKYQEDLIPDISPTDFSCLNLDDPDTVERLRKVLPDLLELVNDLEQILIGDTIIKSVQDRIFLPGEVIVSSFETCVQLLMWNYQLQPTKVIHDALIKLSIVSKKRNEYRAAKIALKNISQRLHLFLKRHHHQSYVKQKSNHHFTKNNNNNHADVTNNNNNNNNNSNIDIININNNINADVINIHNNINTDVTNNVDVNNHNNHNHTYINIPLQACSLASSSSSSTSSSSLSTSSSSLSPEKESSSPSPPSSTTFNFCNINENLSTSSFISSTHPTNSLSNLKTTISDNIGDNDLYDLFGMDDSNFIDWDNFSSNIFNSYELPSSVVEDQDNSYIC